MDPALKDRYDRQIRVWGAEAQSRIQTSRVLVMGLHGLNVEVVKNIVLAGMSVTIQDDTAVKMEDLSFNFFLAPEDIGKSTVEAAMPRIHQLNTYTTVGAETRSLKNLDASFFDPFTVVLMNAKNCTQEDAQRINELCRSSAVKKVFFLSDVFGDEAVFISDFGESFQYQLDKKEKKEGATEGQVTINIQSISFPPLGAVLGKAWSELPSKHFPLSTTYVKSRLLMLYRDSHGAGALPSPESADIFCSWAAQMLSQHNLDASAVFAPGELATLCRTASCVPVVTCSTLGSFLAQEVIKGVSLSGQPGFNVWVFSCHDYQVRAFPIVPP